MKRDLFVTDFWEFDFPEHEKLKKLLLQYIEIKEIKEEIEENKTINPSDSTYGGHEIPILDNVHEIHGDNIIQRDFSQLKIGIESCICKTLIKIEDTHNWEPGKWANRGYWLNVNYKGSFNPPHIHPGSTYSGVYYVQMPPNAGKIHFLDPRPAHRCLAPEIDSKYGENWFRTHNKYDSSVFSYEPVEGKVVVFPSWLMHYVDPNPTEGVRISLAFNGEYLAGH